MREHLALNQYLDNPQVAFNVKRKQQVSLIDAVSSTLEMESYLLPCPTKVAIVDIEIDSGLQGKKDLMMGMLQAMIERLDRLEKQMCPKPTQKAPSS